MFSNSSLEVQHFKGEPLRSSSSTKGQGAGPRIKPRGAPYHRQACSPCT